MSGADGHLGSRFSDDDVLTWASLYWYGNAIAPSFRPYNDATPTRPARRR